LREQPSAGKEPESASLYWSLSLVRYEHVQVPLTLPRFPPPWPNLKPDDAKRQQADFTLTDLHGKT
jgi:hypothetical protein